MFYYYYTVKMDINTNLLYSDALFYFVLKQTIIVSSHLSETSSSSLSQHS